jgi:uncharacterized cupin superfamily protein
VKPIMNIDEVALTEEAHGERYARAAGQIGRAIGAEKLGCRLVVVPPGKRAWPFHAHHANEEMFFVIAGSGSLRLGEAVHAVRAGDVVSCPAGGAATAHQLINSGEADLRYLAISTMIAPEICEYPDSGKFLLLAGAGPGGDASKRGLDLVVRPGVTEPDYWDGE